MRKRTLFLTTVVICAGAVAAEAYATGGPMMMGPTHTVSQPAFKGYYDGHFVTYLSTDISSKAEAKMMHINYSAQIGRVKALPEIYLVQGRSAKGQLAVFGAEPGDPEYSPLWDETILTWKAGSKPGMRMQAITGTYVLHEHTFDVKARSRGHRGIDRNTAKTVLPWRRCTATTSSAAARSA